MILLQLILLAAGSIVPSGLHPLPRAAFDASPLEGRPASFSAIEQPVCSPAGNTVLIVAADYVAEALSPQLLQLQADLAQEGWNATIQSMSGGTAEDLRSLFQGTPDLDGAILVGFLPCAWFEEDYWASEEFPCELFLMDLDGVWNDGDGDGLYDSHTGDVAPEIWLGRIDAHAVDFGNELQMLSEYLQKDHLYRTGAMSPPSRALSYIDDDWYYYSDCGLDYIYGPSGVTVVNSQSQTTAEDYLQRLEEGYEFVHLMAHSCPWGHTFKVPSGMAGTVMAPEIAQVNPQTAFLQLFSCSNARWIESGCLGNWYLFGTDTGLLVSGAAKTGSMLDFEYFYQPVGSGSCFGEAFRDWWEYQASGGFSPDERAWFYGNALLGDPTLRPVSSSSSNGRVYSGDPVSSGYQVSTSIRSDCFPDAASHDGLTAVAWVTGENGRLDVAARFHDDDGDSWSQVYTVDADEYWDNHVTVCFDDSGIPWLAWSDFEYSTYSYRIRTASGIPFANISTAVPQDGYQVAPDLACAGGVWLAWQDWEAEGGRVMVKRLQGTAYEAQLSQPGGWASSPDISPGPDGSLHAVWVRNSPSGSSVMWTMGSDTGGFLTPQEISSGGFCHSPHIAMAGGELVAAWQTGGTVSSIEARIWNGTQWDAAQVVAQSAEHLMSPYVCETPDTGDTLVLWQKGRSPGSPEGSILQDGQWSAPFQPFEPGGSSWNPIASGGMYLWAGSQGDDWNIYSGASTGIEGGTAPSAEVALASNPVRGSLTLSLPGQTSVYSGTLKLFDLSGRAVLSTEIFLSPGGVLAVDCSPLPSGIYSLMLEGFQETTRFTLVH